MKKHFSYFLRFFFLCMEFSLHTLNSFVLFHCSTYSIFFKRIKRVKHIRKPNSTAQSASNAGGRCSSSSCGCKCWPSIPDPANECAFIKISKHKLLAPNECVINLFESSAEKCNHNSHRNYTIDSTVSQFRNGLHVATTAATPFRYIKNCAMNCQRIHLPPFMMSLK